MSHPSIEAMQCLETIVKALAAEKRLSATKLKRTYGFDSSLFDEAVQYGHDKKVIKWGDRNIFSYVPLL